VSRGGVLPRDLLVGSFDDLPETDWSLGQTSTWKSGPLFYGYDFRDGWVTASN
jgi:hypothetical protein